MTALRTERKRAKKTVRARVAKMATRKELEEMLGDSCRPWDMSRQELEAQVAALPGEELVDYLRSVIWMLENAS